MARHRVTKDEFGQFKQAVEKVSAFLGLSDWNISCFLEVPLNETRVFQGYCISLPIERVASIFYWPTQAEKPTLEGIRKTALHEVAHVFLAQLVVEAQARFTLAADVNLAENSIVSQLTNSLFPILFKD